jgi:hypothetical protein
LSAMMRWFLSNASGGCGLPVAIQIGPVAKRTRCRRPSAGNPS